MTKVFHFYFLSILIAVLMCTGCNIVPKSVQYQKEEEKLIGNVDIINPVLEEIQVVLKGLGYDSGTTDGRMGEETREAIKAFQESLGIKSTGYINKRTLTQIEDIRRANEDREIEKTYNVKVRTAYPEEKVSSKTDYTPTTKEVQTALKNAGFNPGAVDGKVGPKTRQAIKEFQRTKGLKVDGIVGSMTWNALGKYLKK